MPRRYLFGPVDGYFSDQFLFEQRQRGDCLTFDFNPGSDLTLPVGASWETLLGLLPGDWKPDLLVLYLPYRTIPVALWSAPIPVVGCVGDWTLLWHFYRRCLPSCDLILTDTPGVRRLAQVGINHAQVAHFYGCERAFLEHPPSQTGRDIDLLFLGNFQPAIQRERLAWLGRLAPLAGRWRVLLDYGPRREEYRALLHRARIVFNRSIRSECNSRTIEATAAGALLFQEEGNEEVPGFFEAGKEYVAYRSDNLESLLEHYLSHEDERLAIAEAGRHRAQQYGFAQLWQQSLNVIDGLLPQLQQCALQRRLPNGDEALLLRVWQRTYSVAGLDPTLCRDLEQALAERPANARLLNGLAVVLAWDRHKQPAQLAAVVELLRRACAIDPTH